MLLTRKFVTVPRGRGLPCHAGPLGEAPGSVSWQEEGKHGHESLLWFLGEGMTKAGNSAHLAEDWPAGIFLEGSGVKGLSPGV